MRKGAEADRSERLMVATVLIIDDEPVIRELVIRLLGPTRHEVVGEAADSETGLALWRQHAPDVIVLDQMMPKVPGLEVARIVLAEKPTQPIILFTAYADRSVFIEAGALGVAACVSKTDVDFLPGMIGIVAAEPTI